MTYPIGKIKLYASAFAKHGFNLLAYSSGDDLLIQSFIAKFHGRKVHGWWNHNEQQYDITPQ